MKEQCWILIEKLNINNLFSYTPLCNRSFSITILQNYQDSVTYSKKKKARMLRAAVAPYSSSFTVIILNPFSTLIDAQKLLFLWNIKPKICPSGFESCTAEKSRMKASLPVAFNVPMLHFYSFIYFFFLLQTIQKVHMSEATKKSVSCTRTRIGQWRGWESDYCSRTGIIAAADLSHTSIPPPHTHRSHKRPPLNLPLVF